METTILLMLLHAILACKGRVIVTGIGKSAIIAQKIVATFNSTGTPAIFMHAADAVHGDLRNDPN
jgi:arabinose-5-phosphate isomerase